MGEKEKEKTGKNGGKNGTGKCGCCKLNVTSGQKGLQCNICGEWSHTRCIGMSERAYETFKEEEDLPWYCKKCTSDKTEKDKMCTMMKELKDEIKEMKTEIKDNKSREKKDRAELMGIIETLKEEKNYEKKEKAELTEIIKELRDQNKNMLSRMAKMENYLITKIEEENDKYKKEIEDKINKEMEEKFERHGKKQNLIIYGVEENEKQNEIESSKIDECRVAAIFQEIDVSEEPLEIIRLGKTKNREKERPILIKMKTERVCYEILKKNNILRNSNDREYNRVTFRKDMTVRQREMNRKLTEELKMRRNKGENVKIKNGKIIRVGDEYIPEQKNL